MIPPNTSYEQLEDPGATVTCKAVMIVDRGNWEGTCAALQVREMLVPQLSTAAKEVPHVLTEDDALPPDTDCALVLCTNGCFHSAHFARQVLAAAAAGVRFIPVVAEENFRFPTEAFYEDVRRRAPSMLQSQELHHTHREFNAEHLVTAIDVNISVRSPSMSSCRMRRRSLPCTWRRLLEDSKRQGATGHSSFEAHESSHREFGGPSLLGVLRSFRFHQPSHLSLKDAVSDLNEHCEVHAHRSFFEAQSDHAWRSADILSTEPSAGSDPTRHHSETEGSLSDLQELSLSF